jgi:hypothetical protein
VASNRCAWRIATSLLFFLLLTRSKICRADTNAPAASLSFTRDRDADTCITARDLARKVEERLGRSAFVSAAQADLFVEANVTRSGRGWRATVSATRANGEKIGVRALKTADKLCHALDDDLILVVALIIDPNASTSPSPEPTAPPPSPIYVEVPVPAPPPRWSYDARVAGALFVNVLSSAVPGLEASFAAKPPGAWPIEIGAAATAVSRTENVGRGADLRFVAGSLAVCPELFVSTAFRAQLCAGAYVGALLVDTFGLGGDENALVVDPFLRLRGGVRLAGPLFAVLDFGGMVALSRPHFTYTQLDTTSLQVDTRELYQMPVIGFVSSIGVALHFP